MITKDGFHKKYNKVLRNVAKDLGLDDFEVRSCRGGPGIMGEVILHAPSLYVMVVGDLDVYNCNVMYRSCRGRGDYVGGTNRWMTLNLLHNNRERALRLFREAMAASGKEPRYPALVPHLI